MFQHLSGKYGVPVSALVGVAIVGLVLFCAIFGMATFSGLQAHWPEMPFAVSLLLAIVAPPVFLVGVGIFGAIHDKWTGESKPPEEVAPFGRSVDERG